ncbi:hypothetical protein C8R44DRAFT_582623, partial [Mycena epipterygia]
CPICKKVFEISDKGLFELHLSIHCASGEAWSCCGVPAECARDYGIVHDLPSYTFLGRERVGGCKKIFSCRRQLERHIVGRFSRC